MAWADEIAKPGMTLVPFLTVDGYPLRIFTRVPVGWAADGWTNVDGLEVPGAIEQEIDPKETRATVRNLRVVVDDTPITGTLAPYRFSRLFGATSRLYADSAAYTAELATELNAGDLTITLSHAIGMPALPFDAHVGNECVTVVALVAGLTYTITRNVYPCVAATVWGQWHRVATGSPWRYPVSTIPYSWFNRRVALYFTWIDSNGTWGPKAEVYRRWVGRINGFQFLGNDQWALDCSPITDDVTRSILAPTTATTTLERGFEFRGTPAADRLISGADLGTTGGGDFLILGEAATTITAQFYDSIQALMEEIETQIHAVLAPATYGYLSHRIEIGDDGIGKVIALWDANGTDQRQFNFFCSPAIAQCLGLEQVQAHPVAGTNSARGYIQFRWDGGAWNPQEVTFPGPYATHYWQWQCSRIKVTDSAGFTPGAMGDGSNAAIEVGDVCVRRYESIAGNDFVTPWANVQDNTTAHFGDTAICVLNGPEYQSISVRQVYLMPRSYGAIRATDWGVIVNLLRLLTSTGSGFNGTYDVYPQEYGLGIPVDLIDVASFEFVADLLPWVQERRWCLREAAPVTDVLDPEGLVLGFYVVQDATGRIAARVARNPRPGSPIVTLDEGNKAATPGRAELVLPAASIVNAGNLTYGYPIIGDDPPRSVVNVGNPLSQSMYGERRARDIEHRGLWDYGDGAVQDIIAGMVTQFARTSYPQATISRTTSRDLFSRLIPGDLVRVTDAAVPDTDTGDRGITARVFTVRFVREDIHGAGGSVSLVRDSIHPANLTGPVCPSALVTAAVIIGAGPNYRLTLGANEFTNAADGVDRDAFAVNDACLFVEGDAADPTAATSITRTVVAIGPAANQIDVDGALTGLVPATGVVYMTFARHITAVPPPTVAIVGQLDRGTWFAGTDGFILDSTTYRGHVYD